MSIEIPTEPLPRTKPDGTAVESITDLLSAPRVPTRFWPESVPDADLGARVRRAGQAPPLRDADAWRFVVVRGEEARRRIRRAAYYGFDAARPRSFSTPSRWAKRWSSHRRRRSTPIVLEIEADPNVAVTYESPKEKRYVAISGRASIVHDPKKLASLWDAGHEKWFPQGKLDPNWSSCASMP